MAAFDPTRAVHPPPRDVYEILGDLRESLRRRTDAGRCPDPDYPVQCATGQCARTQPLCDSDAPCPPDHVACRSAGGAWFCALGACPQMAPEPPAWVGETRTTRGRERVRAPQVTSAEYLAQMRQAAAWHADTLYANTNDCPAGYSTCPGSSPFQCALPGSGLCDTVDVDTRLANHDNVLCPNPSLSHLCATEAVHVPGEAKRSYDQFTRSYLPDVTAQQKQERQDYIARRKAVIATSRDAQTFAGTCVSDPVTCFLSTRGDTGKDALKLAQDSRRQWAPHHARKRYSRPAALLREGHPWDDDHTPRAGTQVALRAPGRSASTAAPPAGPAAQGRGRAGARGAVRRAPPARTSAREPQPRRRRD